MSPSKIRPALITVGVLLAAAIAVGVVVGIGDESGNAQRGAPYVAPAAATLRVGANAKAQVAGSAATGRTERGLAPAMGETHTPPAHPEAPAPAATTKKAPAGTPQGNGGDSDPDNNGGPDDGDGAI